MVSRSDHTRPYLVAYNDPYNRRFRMVGNSYFSEREGELEWTWKKLTSCHSSKCCNKPWQKKEKAKRRHSWKQDLRREGND